MENQWGINEEDPNRFLPQPENPYAGMDDIDRGGNRPYQGGAYDSVAQPNPWGVQDNRGGNGANGWYYSDMSSSSAYGDMSGNGAGGYTDYNNTPAEMDARDRGGALPDSPYGYTYSPTGNYTMPSSGGTSGSGTKRLEDLPKVDYDKNDPRGKDSADKGANIVSPANSGGGQPRASSGGGGGGQPQQYGQSQGQGGQPQQSYRPPANWDENAYLKANPDVAAAVRAGTQKSGYDHFANYGVKEGRTMTVAQQQPQADPRITRAEEAAKQAQAQMQAMQQAQQQQREAQARSNAQNQILSARVVGTGAGGEQIVRFTEGTPRGYTPDFAALSASTGLGAASLMRAWRDQGGQLDGEIMPMRGGNVSAPSAGATGGMGATSPRGNAIIDAQGFNDAAYLAQNPDVADAVRRGEYKSGFDHWAQRGRNEVRPGGRELNEFEKANPWAIGVQTPEGGWKLPTTTPTTPTATTGADKYLTPEQQAGNMVAPGSVPTTNPWGLQEPPQVVPQITTGTNYIKNGSADRWEFDPIQGVWTNGRGDTRPYEDNPNALDRAMVGGNVMLEQRVGVDGNIRMPINPATGTNYTKNADRWEFDPIRGVLTNGRGDTLPYEDNLNALRGVWTNGRGDTRPYEDNPNALDRAMVGGNVMPEQRVGVDGNIRMPINPATGRPYIRTR